MGERTSARLFAAALKARGIKAKFFDPSDRDWPIITNSQFGNANPLLRECISRIKETVIPLLEKGIVPVLPGFIGKTLKGEVTVLGRGGSDTTAFILAKAIGAAEVVLVTDVDGIMTADPKIVSAPKRISKISVKELVNLCDSGVKFLHRKALRYLDGSFKVRVVNYKCERLNDGGTIIEGKPSENRVSTRYNSPIAMITITNRSSTNNPKPISQLIKKIAELEIPFFAWSANLDSICGYVPETNVEKAVRSLHHSLIERGYELAVAVRKNLAFIKIFGVETERTSDTFRRLSESLARNGINTFWISTVASSILLFVEWKSKDAALSAVRNVLKSLED